MASSSYARKVLPKKLEEDLSNISHYKPREVPLLPTGSTATSGKQALHRVLDDSIERAMFDEILGPLVNPRSYRRPQSMQSPTKPSSGLGSYGENVINMHNNSNLSGLLKSAISSSPSSSSSLPSKDAGTATGTGRSPRKITGNSQSNTYADGNTFNDSILARLTSVEADNKAMRKQLAEKIQRLEQVEAENVRLRRVLLEVNEEEDDDEDDEDEEKNKGVILGADDVLRGTVKSSESTAHRYGQYNNNQNSHIGASNRRLLNEVEELRLENTALEQQVSDMEQFLSDYGLTWVGSEGTEGGLAADNSANSAPNSNSGTKGTKDTKERSLNANTNIKSQSKLVPDSKSYYTLGGNEARPANTGVGNISNISTRSNLAGVSAGGGHFDTRSPSKPIAISATAPSQDNKNNTLANANIYHVDFHDFKRKVDSLNAVIHSEPAQIKQDKYGNGKTSRIMQPSEFMEKVPVTFYNNGILIRRGPFRAHDSASYKAFCRDVLDGYFPSDFRDDHPDGVLFELIDKHQETYSVETLSNANDSSSSNWRTLVDGSINGGGNFSRQYTKDQLLNNLPGHQVNAKGDVINIRSEISEKFNSSDIAATAGTGAEHKISFSTNTDRVVSNLVLVSGVGVGQVVNSTTSEGKMNGGRLPVGAKSSSRGEAGDADAPPSYKLSGLLQSSERLAQLSHNSEVGSNSSSTNADAKTKLSAARNSTTTGGASNVIIISTAASESQAKSGSSGGSTALIRAKWLDGTMLHMKLWESDLVGDIRENIRRHIYNTKHDQDANHSTTISGKGPAVNEYDAFDLRAAYPPKLLSNSMTLTEAGLVPNGTVIAMATKK